MVAKAKKYWLVLVLLIVVLLRLPSLFEPFTYGDEGIYLTLGQAANKGLVWYKDIHDNKPPLLYLIAALAHNFTAYRLIHFGWSLITVLAFWQLAKLIFPKNQPAEILATATFGILTSLHSFEGNVANAENFMLLPTIAAFYLVYEAVIPIVSARLPAIRSQGWPWLLAGLFLGIATLFKIPAAFDFAAALAFTFLGTKKKNYSLLVARCSLLAGGFFFPILASFIYYYFQRALSQYLTAAFFQNLPYLASWGQSAPQSNGLPLILLARGFSVLLLFIGLFIYQKKIPPSIRLILIWFGFSWFAALLSSRPYPHYLIQILPAFSLSVGLIWPSRKKASFKIYLPLTLAIFFQITFLSFHFWSYPNREYYQNFYRYALGLETKQDYWETFDPQAKNLYQTADYLRAHTHPDEKIFIWGTVPSIYALAERLPIGRYTTSYHIIDFNGYAATLEALESERPRYILVSRDEERPFFELKNWLMINYLSEKIIGGIEIYHRVNSFPD